jgi:aminoglycoside phosphotransferase (APT) family kinase protein
MLSPADAELVRIDPALPGLSTLLDPEAFAARVRRALPYLDVESARLTYLQYRPGTSCLVGYRLQGDQGWELDVAATCYRSNERKKLTRAREAVFRGGSCGAGVFVLEDCASVMTIFPRDRRLRSLQRLADQDGRRRVLTELLPGHPELRRGRLYSLGYKPEHRHVALFHADNGTRVIIKAYTRGRYETARQAATFFNSHGRFRVPRLIGVSDRRRLLAFEWLPGRALDEPLTSATPPLTSVAVAAAALAEFHNQNPYRLPLHDRRKDEVSLLTTAKAIRYLCPDQGERACHLACHLAERLRDNTPAPRALHGNLQPRHVLLTENAVAFLDLDKAARGNPAIDLGNFLAHLELLLVGGVLTSTVAINLRNAFLEGYQAMEHRVAPAWIELGTAIGLFQLALHPFRVRVPDWPTQVGQILDRCAALARWPARSLATKVEVANQSDTVGIH